MFAKKVDAMEMHKFIKDNLHSDCQSVDLRECQFDEPNLKYGLIYIKSEEGLEPNYIMFNDEKFVILTSNKTKNEKLSSLSSEEINKIWQQYLCLKFGARYMFAKTLNENCK